MKYIRFRSGETFPVISEDKDFYYLKSFDDLMVLDRTVAESDSCELIEGLSHEEGEAMPKPEDFSPVNPSHYDSAITPLQYIEANNLDFLEGNIVKYVSRFKRKNGVEDLKKAEFYLKRLIEINS